MTDSTPERSYPEQSGHQVTGRRQSKRRKWIMLAILLLILLLVSWMTYYYLQNRRLPVPGLSTSGEEEVAPPEYVFSILGPQGADALTRPIGVAVGQNDNVYAVDTKSGVIRVFTKDGDYLFTFGEVADASAAALVNPAHIVTDQDEFVYVSDRRLRAVFVFEPDGTYVRTVKLVGDEGDEWSPLGMFIDEDGDLWVTDVGMTDKHRVIEFGPDGVEKQRFGSTAEAVQMSDFPGQFYFPNGIVKSDDGRLYVGDSNNRRVQVFTPEGEFDFFIRTSGIPRGMAIDEEDRLYVVDALGHMIDVFTLDGDRIVSFGAQGLGPGQFQYANDVALDSNGRIYVSDRQNHQVQVWEWPPPPVIIPELPRTPSQWALCLSPLLFIPPILFLLRRRRYALTPDFVDAMVVAEKVDIMPRRRRKWVTPEEVWPAFDGRVEQDIDLGELVSPQEHSDSDARDLMDRMGVSMEDAILLVVARRAKRLCTQDERIASLAGALEIEVFDAERFIETHDRGAKGRR